MNDKKELDRLARELGELGAKIQASLKAAAASPEARAVRGELADSLDRLGGKVAQAADSARRSAAAAEIKAQADKVAEAGRLAAGELQQNLAAGLRDVSAALRGLADKLEEKK